jgi:hypothetical protein
VSGYQAKLKKLQNTVEWKKILEVRGRMKKMEKWLNDNYSKDFAEKPVDWWKNELHKLEVQKQASTFEDEKNSVERIINYLGMIGYLYCNAAINSGNNANGSRYLQIYELVSPDNPDVYYFKTLMEVQNGSNTRAIEYLNTAADKGFFDLDKINNEPRFVPLKKMAEFTQISEKVRMNFER